jgi:hypothetical protein
MGLAEQCSALLLEHETGHMPHGSPGQGADSSRGRRMDYMRPTQCQSGMNLGNVKSKYDTNIIF